MDLKSIKTMQQQAWSAGNYARISTSTAFASEVLCEALDIRAGETVLDVATGSGNAALAAARRGAVATGVDYVPDLLRRAAVRAATEFLDVHFEIGDAECLPFAEGQFDVVMSSFGAMFAPDPELTVGELARVCRSGGRLGMANWTPRGLIGALLRVNSQFAPPPPGLPSPILWGNEQTLRARLSPHFENIRLRRKFCSFHASTIDEWLRFLFAWFGPLKVTYDALPEDQRKDYTNEMRVAVTPFNQAAGGSLYAPAEYVEAVATRREYSRLQ